MSDAPKKDPNAIGRISRRVECVAANEDLRHTDTIVDEAPIDETIRDYPVDSLEIDTLEIDTSEGFNPYDTGSLYKKSS